MARILVFSVPTLCIFNGHSIAAGVLFGLSFDQILMKSDKFLKIQMSELQIGASVPIGMANFIFKLTNPATSRYLLAANPMNPQQAL